MTFLDPNKTIEQLAEENPKILPALEKFGIHYEFASGLSLADVCFVHQFNLEDLARQIETSSREAMMLDENILANYGIPELIGYILFTHHAFLEKELPRLAGLLVQAIEIDGPNHPELLELMTPFKDFKDSMEWHMKEEEKHLFPFLLLLVVPKQSPALSPESIETLIRLFESEDVEIEVDLDRLRKKTRGYHVPENAGQVYREFLHDLSRLEGDLSRHMRVENEILFPKVVAAEKELMEREVKNELARQGSR